MTSSALAAGLHHLRDKLAARQRSGESDEQLLHAFTSRRDDSAFTVLVQRHGPMVLHVCRRVLGNEQDAEDAFQATFLVLARNVAALRSKTSLASFLHGTAYRTAMKAKQSATRRRKHEGSLRALTQPRSPIDPADELSWREVRALLDEEISRLPEIYRSVFVLCHLEDLSRAEAAQRLGLKECTVLSRLAKARKTLSQRLRRRGVELTAVLAATALATPPASAVPAGLMASTIRAALATAAGEKLAGIVSASVAQLVKSATAAMAVSKAKIATVLLLAVSMLAGASVLGYRGLAANALMPSALPAETPAVKADHDPRTASPKRAMMKTLEIQGRVLDPEGKPKAGAVLLWLGKGAKLRQLGTTAEDGRFRVAISQESKDGYLIAQAEGFGLDFIDLPTGDSNKPIEFRLVKDRAIRSRIVNTEGKPVAGVRVAVNELQVFANNSMDSFLRNWKNRYFTSGMPNGIKRIWSAASKLFAVTTDAEGRFTLSGLGDERLVSLRLSGGGIAEDELWVVNRKDFDPKPYDQATLKNIPKDREGFANRLMLHGPDVPIVAEAEKPIHGIVKDADTGRGRPGVVVQLMTRGNSGGISLKTRTDAQGRYEIHGARKAGRYMVEVADDPSAGYMTSLTRVADTPGYQAATADIATKKGVIIIGKVIDNATGKPVPAFVTSAVLYDNPFVKQYPEFVGADGYPMRRSTQPDGTFRAVAIPGLVLVVCQPKSNSQTWFQFKPAAPDPKYPQYFVNERPLLLYLGVGGLQTVVQGNHCKVLEIKPDARIVEQDIVLERASAIPIQIQDAGGKPLPNVWITGSNALELYPAIKCEKAECTAYQIEPGKPRLMAFYHPGRRLAGALTLKGDERLPIVAKLGQAGSIRGRLLDADAKPLAGVAIRVQYRQPTASELHKVIHRGKQVVTDAAGVFVFNDLIPQQEFKLSFRHDKRTFERVARPADSPIQVNLGEYRDLGTIKLKPLSENTGE